MADTLFIRIGKIHGSNGVLDSLSHNKRTLQAENGSEGHIDESKSILNYSLTEQQSPDVISRHAKSQMALAGIYPPRKNCVMGVEVIFSLPVSRHGQESRPFFEECFEWVKKVFACEVLSFDVHLDESAPHAHAIILPLIDGKMQGNKLVGNKWNLNRIVKSFLDEVGSKFELCSVRKKSLTVKEKLKIAKKILRRLKYDPATESIVWPCINQLIRNNPTPFAEILDILILN
jgi:hypothetical protein